MHVKFVNKSINLKKHAVFVTCNNQLEMNGIKKLYWNYYKINKV